MGSVLRGGGRVRIDLAARDHEERDEEEEEP